MTYLNFSLLFFVKGGALVYLPRVQTKRPVHVIHKKNTIHSSYSASTFKDIC